MAITHAAVKVSGQRAYASEWNDAHVVSGVCIEANNCNFKVGSATLIVDVNGKGDYTDIQSALNALPAGGGKILVKEGTYNIAATITIPISNVAIIGSGYATEIKSTGNFNVFYADTKSNLIFEKLQINGSGAPNNQNRGFNLTNCNYVYIKDCHIWNVGWNAIAISSGWDIWIVNNYISSLGGNGIYLGGTASTIWILGNEISGNGASGIQITTPYICYIMDNSIYSNGTYGILLGNNYGSQIIGNLVEASWYHGIYVYGSQQVTIKGNYICGSGQAANNTYSNIHLEVYNSINSIRNIISGNEILGAGYGIFPLTLPKYGYREANANQDKNIVLGNVVVGAMTANISVQGANTINQHNIVT
jgi:parallel beta-helix repeat protein